MGKVCFVDTKAISDIKVNAWEIELQITTFYALGLFLFAL